MDYLYSLLNLKLSTTLYSDYTPTEIKDSTTITVNKSHIDDVEQLQLNVNTNNLVRLQVVKNDVDATDDVIQKLRLVGFNKDTGAFDIKLGDDIIINHLNLSGGGEITLAIIAGQKIPASIDSLGQLILQYIPSIAISDLIAVEDPDGNMVFHLIESTIDCND